MATIEQRAQQIIDQDCTNFRPRAPTRKGRHVFFCLRDNFVTDTSKPWMTKFRNLAEIQFIMKMINIDNQPTVETIINEWNQMKPKIKLITNSKLISLGVHPWYLQIQYVHSRYLRIILT